MRIPILPLLCLLTGCSTIHQISHSGAGAYEASVAVSAGQIAVAWYDDRQGNGDIYLSLFDTALKPLHEERQLTRSAAPSYEADIVFIAGNIAAAWYYVDADGRSRVMLGLWDERLDPLWEIQLTDGRSGRIPELIRVGDRLFIAWVEDYDRPGGDDTMSDIRGAWVNQTGEFGVAPFFIASASATTWNLNGDVYDDETVALVYDAAYDTAESELYLTVVNGNSAVTQRLTSDDLFASKYPDIAFNGTHAAISWHDERDGNQEIYLASLEFNRLWRQNSLARAVDLDDLAQRVTDTAGASIGAYLAWHGDTLGLAWCDNSGGQHDIFFRTFSPAGMPASAPRQLTRTGADSLIPAIEAVADGFVIAWNEARIDGHGTDRNRTTSEIYLSMPK